MIAADLKAGMVVRQDAHLHQVLLNEFHKGGGKMGGLQHVKLRSLSSGVVLERRFRPDEKVEVVDVEKQNLEYLYQDGEFYVFMNPKTYEQMPLHSDLLGHRAQFLQENMTVTGLSLDGKTVSLQFPAWVDLRVITSPPPRHEQETSTYKTITLENGMEILAPHFIKQGDTVRVDVETGKYLERV